MPSPTRLEVRGEGGERKSNSNFLFLLSLCSLALECSGCLLQRLLTEFAADGGLQGLFVKFSNPAKVVLYIREAYKRCFLTFCMLLKVTPWDLEACGQ